MKKETLKSIFNNIELNERVLEPAGWLHFDKECLAQEKIKILKKFNLEEFEIINFLNSMPNSRNVNDTIRKIGAKGGLERFLRYNPVEKSLTKQVIERMIKRGY